MAPLIADILKDYEYRPENCQRIAFREVEQSVEIVAPDPNWPEIFNSVKARIVAALGDKAIAVHHTGSTSIPGLPAKNVIDIDLVVPDSTDEAAYVSQLEAAGFQFLIREPTWHEHRFFAAKSLPVTNLHVWSPDSPEVIRHQIFRERLLRSSEDKEKYREVKELAARQTREDGGIMVDYNLRKEDVIRQILRRAFVDLGYLDQIPKA